MIHAFDVETFLIAPGRLTPRLVCGSIAWAGGAEVLSAADTTAWLEHFLRVTQDHIVGANIAYDMAVMANHDPSLTPLIFQAYDEGRIHDVQIRMALHAIAEGHLYKHPNGGPLRDPETGKVSNRYSLSICAELLLGKGLAKKDTWRLRYAELAETPIDKWPYDAIQYSRQDAITTLEVFNAQQSFRNLQDEPAQVRAAFALHLASVWGLKTDPERVSDFAKTVESEYLAAKERFQQLGILREDGSCDTRRLKARIELAYGKQPPRTDKGATSTSRDTLAESGDPILEEYAEIGENKTLHNTFLPTLQMGVYVPIGAKWNTLVVSGRNSCEKPNLLNLPRKGGVRECFKARTLYGLNDYSAIELCSHSQNTIDLLGESAMAEAINSDLDLHTLFASNMSGVPYLELLALVKAGDKRAEELRQAAKAANFGFPGGMGVAKFVQTKRKEGLNICFSPDCGKEKVRTWGKDRHGKPVNITPTCLLCLQSGQKLRDAWFQQWPEMKRYFALISDAVNHNNGEIEQLFSKRIRGACTFTEAANTLFQGRTADGAKRALWDVSRACYTEKASPLFGSRVVIFAYDELICEVPEDRASEAVEEMSRVMVKAMQVVTPDVKIKTDGALCRYWFKGARELRVNGRIVPVKPGPDGRGWVHDA